MVIWKKSKKVRGRLLGYVNDELLFIVEKGSRGGEHGFVIRTATGDPDFPDGRYFGYQSTGKEYCESYARSKSK